MIKKFFLLALIFVVSGFASVAFVGMTNSKYGFVGIKPGENFGVAVVHSLWVQDVSQYVSLNPFYSFVINENISGMYSVFAGTTYERSYYNYGADLYMNVLPWKHFVVEGRFKPRYDSDLGLNYGYEALCRIFVFDEVSFFGGAKNIPEYRAAEDRFFGGISFMANNLRVSPQFSIPIDMESQYMRIHVNFVYGLVF